MSDVWNDRDLPVLREIVAALDDAEYVTVEQVSDRTGLPAPDVRRAGARLHQGGLVTVEGFAELPVDIFTGYSSDALRAAGVWPSPEAALGRMIAALEVIVDNTDDDADRTRARKILDALTGAGRTVGLGVATAVITGQLPGQ